MNIKAFAWIACTVAASSLHAGVVGYTVDVTQTLASIDLLTGVSTPIGTGTVFLESLALSPLGVLYGADAGGDLYTIDTATGVDTLVGSTGLGDIEGLFFNGSTLFGSSLTSSGTIFQIDVSDAAATSVFSTGAGTLRALALLNSTTVYGLSDGPSFQTLVSIDLTTGNFTALGFTGSPEGIYGLAFAPGGTLYGVGGDGGSYSIDPTTGASTYLGGTGPFYLDLAVQSSNSDAAPEPASFGLFGAGLLTVGYLSRKRLAAHK